MRAALRRSDYFKPKPPQRRVQIAGKDGVVVVDDEAILAGGRKEWFSQLLEGPGGGGMGGRVEVNQSTRGMLHYHQHVEDWKAAVTTP